jgi:ADP-ribose pyrophosphatase YjhB (NUDIX family)
MPVRKRSTARKEVSVMAWITGPKGSVLMVKQSRAKKLWALPGGKVRARESLERAVRREVREETGQTLGEGQWIEIFDRSRKANVTFLYVASLKNGALAEKKALLFRSQEIAAVAWQRRRPVRCTISANYFWTLMRGRDRTRLRGVLRWLLKKI